MTELAGSVSLDRVLTNLAATRPVFHSEADLQHAFAWEAHKLDADLEVRLETHPEPNVRLDLLISRSDTGRHTALDRGHRLNNVARRDGCGPERRDRAFRTGLSMESDSIDG